MSAVRKQSLLKRGRCRPGLPGGKCCYFPAIARSAQGLFRSLSAVCWKALCFISILIALLPEKTVPFVRLGCKNRIFLHDSTLTMQLIKSYVNLLYYE